MSNRINTKVRLDFEQRQRASALEEAVADEPLYAAYELISLRDTVARTAMNRTPLPKDGGPACICPQGATVANCPQCGDTAALTAAARPIAPDCPKHESGRHWCGNCFEWLGGAPVPNSAPAASPPHASPEPDSSPGSAAGADPIDHATLAAQMNADTVREQQREIARLRAMLASIAGSRGDDAPALRLIAREALAK